LKNLAASLLCALLPYAAVADAQDVAPYPIYMRVDSGWVGFFAKGGEYARYQMSGANVQFQDATHMLLGRVGLMVTFADRKNLVGPDLLVAHAHWEEDYWHGHAAKVDTLTRTELASGRSDVRVTELTVWNTSGGKLGIDLVGLEATDGVFAFAFSPASDSTSATVRRFVQGLSLVRKPLTREEAARIADSLKKRPP
jgi:hypothetical protein